MTTTTYAVVLGSDRLAGLLFGPDLSLLDHAGARRLGAVHCDVDAAETRAAIAGADVLITGWGTPALSSELLDSAGRLRAVIHAGGSALGLLPGGASDRFALSVAAVENARPVAEYATATIVLALKRASAAQRLYRKRRSFIDRHVEFAGSGAYDRTVGLVGASRTGRLVIEMLKALRLDVNVLVFDPYLSPAEARALGVESAGLDEVCSRSGVLSIHAPLLPETVGLIGAAQLSALPDEATIINTARGALIDNDALVAELRSGRIDAVLDVTEPEPLEPNSIMWDLENVVLTPHIAGSMGREIRRLGEHVRDELARFVRGEPFAEPDPSVRRPVKVGP